MRQLVVSNNYLALAALAFLLRLVSSSSQRRRSSAARSASAALRSSLAVSCAIGLRHTVCSSLRARSQCDTINESHAMQSWPLTTLRKVCERQHRLAHARSRLPGTTKIMMQHISEPVAAHLSATPLILCCGSIGSGILLFPPLLCQRSCLSLRPRPASQLANGRCTAATCLQTSMLAATDCTLMAHWRLQ